jgi:glycosyltransferase involved in cell wall biosynthesis
MIQTHDRGSDVTGRRRTGDERRHATRVLFVAEAFGGGMFEITRMQAEGLSERGFTVAIAYGRRPETPDDVSAVVDGSIDLLPLPWTNRTLKAQLLAQRALRRVIRAWRPDIVHLMSSFAGIHGVLSNDDVPTVYTPQAYAFTMAGTPLLKRWLYLAIESFVASRVSVVGACSLSEGEQARALPGSKNVVVVPNGIDELSRDRIGKGPAHPDRELRVVGVGRPAPQRRPDACARILATAGAQENALWIGGGAEGTPGAAALTSVGIPMTGWMPRSETLSALGDSTLYLHWTAWDGLPLSILEAMALDVIVVASDIGPNREVLGPDQVCRTEREAAALIRRLLSDAELRQTFLANQQVRRRAYGSDAMVDEWADVYAGLT